MENMIETKDVIQSFPIAGGKELVVLKNINIQIPTGKLTMLRGRSGSGKTTLMNLLSALDYPKSGEILFEGKPIQDLPGADAENADWICFSVSGTDSDDDRLRKC